MATTNPVLKAAEDLKALVAGYVSDLRTRNASIAIDVESVEADRQAVAEDREATQAAAEASDADAINQLYADVLADKATIAADKAIVASDKAATQGFASSAALAMARASTLAAAALLNLSAGDNISIDRWAPTSPIAPARYKRVAQPGNVQPTHDLKFQDAAGKWFEIDESVLTPAMAGAEIGLTNQVAAFTRMASHPAKEWRLPAGISWRVDGDVVVNHDLTLRGAGTLDFSSGTGQLLISGTLTQIGNLSVDVAKHARSLTFGTAHGLAPGDIVVLYNPTDFSFGSRLAHYRDGGMFRVHTATSGTVVKTYEMAVDAYAAASMTVYKLTPAKVLIDGVTLVPSGGTSKAPLQLTFCADVHLRGIKTMTGGTYAGVSIDRCYNVGIEDVVPLNNSPHVDDEYGIVIANSQHISIRGAGAFATRHAIAMGGSNQAGCVPTRFVTVSGMSLWNSPAGSTGAGDIHGNCDYVTYSDCVMAGFTGGGRNVRAIGCTILGMEELPSGLCVQMPELPGGYVELINCTFMSQGDGQSNSHGFLNFLPTGPSGGGNPAGTNMKEDLFIRVLGCRFVTPNAGTLAKAVLVEGYNANKKVNIEIKGCSWERPGGGNVLTFLYARETVLAALPSDFIIVDDVKGPSGTYLCYAHSTITAIPKRMMAQRIASTVSCPSGSGQALGAVTNFRHPFPSVPECFALGFGSTDGAAKNTWGGRALSVHSVSRTATAGRIGVNSIGGNFTSTEDVRLTGTFGIADI